MADALAKVKAARLTADSERIADATDHIRLRLMQAIVKQENALHAMEKTHGECMRRGSLSSGDPHG